MSQSQSSRRDFLKASIAVAPLALSPAALLAAGAPAAAPEAPAAAAPAPAGVLPTRKLGKTGRDITMLNIGGMMGAHETLIEIAWSLGVRYFDTADCYKRGQSEKNIAAWLGKHPERRKDLFLVSKDHPRGGIAEIPAMVDARLAACGTDYLDLFFIHGIGTREYGQGSLEWPKSKELAKIADDLKKAGKIKAFGFSCHDDAKVQYFNAAAEGGFIDAIMVAYSPFMNPGEDLDKAIGACHKADIGMVAMKNMRAFSPDIPKRIPEFDKLGLTARQALLQVVWSDERIASICSQMDTAEQIKENTAAATMYKEPLKKAQVDALRHLAFSKMPGMCPNCDGSCGRAAGGDIRTAMSDIARYVNYYERDGDMGARDLYHALPAVYRDFSRADLVAAQAAKSGLDFAEIAKKAEYYFA